MPLPPVEDMLLPMLRLFAQGKERLGDCLPALARDLELSSGEAEKLTPSGRETVLSNRAQWARIYLCHAGLVQSHARGRYHITEDGQRLLQSKPPNMTWETLEQYPAWLTFVERIKLRDKKREQERRAQSGSGQMVMSEATTYSSEDVIEETPDDIIAHAYAQAETALVAELLEAILTMTPTRFEQLIVDLLVKMGYGGGDPAMGERLGRSGDGGIDGIINEDALGLDAVYVQAKRYAPENKIGRPALQAFVGSLTGEGATKGVFVTTSDFSREACDYLNRVQQRIVLINDDRLARLLIQHEVGVRARKTYVLRSVDEDYFADT